MHFFGNFSYLSFVKLVWQVNYCNTGLPNLSSMSGKIPVLELLPKMLSSDMIAGFHKILYHKMNWHMNGHKGSQNIILQSRTFCIFLLCHFTYGNSIEEESLRYLTSHPKLYVKQNSSSWVIAQDSLEQSQPDCMIPESLIFYVELSLAWLNMTKVL